MSKGSELKSILVVEDDDSHAFLVKYMLKQAFENAEIDHVWDGQEAIDHLEGIAGNKAKDSFPDLILLDINMPKLDGFQFLEAFVKSEALPDLNVIMLSSSSLQKDKDRAAELGASGFLIKPLEMELLLAAVEKIGYNPA